MSPIEDYSEILQRVAALLHAFSLRFHLTGGAATILHGEPRLTLDVDIVIDRDRLAQCLPDFLAAVSRAGYIHSAATIRDAVSGGRQFQLIDPEGFKLDFYPRELVPGELERSVTIEISQGFSLPLVSRSDLAIAKLIWVSKGSHKSRRDLRKIILAASPAERETVEHAANDRGLRTLLNEVLAESDEIID